MQIAREAARTARSGQPVGSKAPIGLRAIAGSTWRERVVMSLAILTTLAMLVTIWAVFAYAPVDAVQGVAFRIFYFHVPMAWVAYLAFFVVFIASIVYLWRKDERWDWLARASAELGTVFTTLVLITGSLWGRPIWGTWWTWDPRLTTTLILWFMYLAYVMVRAYAEPPRGPRFGSKKLRMKNPPLISARSDGIPSGCAQRNVYPVEMSCPSSATPLDAG